MKCLISKCRNIFDCFNARIKSTIYLRFAIYGVVDLLIFSSIFNNLFAILSFIIVLFFLLITDKIYGLELLFASMPFAWIFKVGFFSTSLFTVLEICYLLLLIIKERRITTYSILFISVTCSLFCLNLNINLVDFIKHIFYCLFIFQTIEFLSREKRSFCYVVYAFLIGVILSSFLGLLRDYVPALSSKFPDPNYIYFGSIKMTRFSGLWTDPNYYNLMLTLCLFTLVPLIINKRINLLFAIPITVLVLFGIITLSKSFVLMLLILYVFLLLFSLFNTRWTLFFVVVGIGIILFVLIISGALPFISRTIERFGESDFTTGRTGIWGIYFKTMSNCPFNLLFGFGLNHNSLINNLDFHNYYIEMLYHIGVVPTVVYFGGIVFYIYFYRINDTIKRNINWSLILSSLCLFVSIFFLSELFNYFMPIFYVFIFGLSTLEPNGCVYLIRTENNYLKISV